MGRFVFLEIVHMQGKEFLRERKQLLTLDSTPHQGAGAGMAIEDAAVLSRVLGAVERPERKDLQAAFKVYDTLRRPRTQKLVTTSREAGMLYEFQVPGIVDDIEKGIADIQQRVRWIWNVNVEELCHDAVSLLKEDLKSD